MVDHPLNEQHEWGGAPFQPTSNDDTGGQTVLPSRPAADTDPSQVPFTASISDDLFAPATGGHSQFLPYILPNVPDFYHPRQNGQYTPTAPHSFYYNNNQPVPNAYVPLSYDRTPVSHNIPLHHNPSGIHSHVPHNSSYINHPQPPPVPHHIRYIQRPQPSVPFPPQFRDPPQPQYQPTIPLPYQNPQIQYVYLPTPQPDTSLLAPPSKSLPVITTIHSLNSKSDFFAWDEGVCTLLRILGIHGHILDPTLPVDLFRPDQSPALPPVLSQPPTPPELKALSRWQENDNVAQYVIVGRLGGLARQLLPSAYMGTRTAYTMYATITRYFGLQNFGDCDELATSLLQSRCEHNRVQDYVARWRAGITRLCSAKYPFSTRVFINAFVKSLPNTITFATLRAFLPDRLASWNDSDIGSFIMITNEVMDLEVAFRNSPSSVQSRSRSGPRSSSLATQVLTPPPPLPSTTTVPSAPSSAIPPAPPRAPKLTLTCGNCKERGLRYTGHTDGTCFQQGGGMEGRREEYMSNKGRFHAMFVECLDNASLFCESATLPDHFSPPSSPHSLPILDNEIVIPPIANLCVTSSPHNFDLRDDLMIYVNLSFLHLHVCLRGFSKCGINLHGLHI